MISLVGLFSWLDITKIFFTSERNTFLLIFILFIFFFLTLILSFLKLSVGAFLLRYSFPPFSFDASLCKFEKDFYILAVFLFFRWTNSPAHSIYCILSFPIHSSAHDSEAIWDCLFSFPNIFGLCKQKIYKAFLVWFKYFLHQIETPFPFLFKSFLHSIRRLTIFICSPTTISRTCCRDLSANL